MTAQSEQKLKNFLVDLKNTDATSAGNEEKANHEKVIDLIKVIGEVKLDEESINKIKKAREAYDYLSGDEKKYVTNYSNLEKAENDYKALEQQNKENKQKQEEDEAGKFKQSIKDKLSSDAYKEGDEWSFRLYCPDLGKLPVGEVKTFKSSDEAVNGIINLVEIAKKLPFETKIKLSKQKKSDGANASVFMNIGKDHNVTLAESVIKSDEEDDMSEEEFLEELGKELKNSRECKEAWNAHDNFVNPGVIDESPELEGTDNAVKKCKPYKLVAHCEEENIDCEMKKPALEKPLLEDINNIFDLFEAKDMKDDELPVDPEAAKLEVHTMLNDLVADEIEAINGYDDAKAEIMDTPIEHKDNILDTIDHIKEEEQEHIDELINATTEIPFDKEEHQEHQDFAAEEGELAEETHAKYAKPEGDRVAAYNNALKYAKKENKPFIYGYTQMGDGKFFALEQPIKISSSPAEAEEEFKNKYKRCSTVYTVYPDKEFIKETLDDKSLEEGWKPFNYKDYNGDEVVTVVLTDKRFEPLSNKHQREILKKYNVRIEVNYLNGTVVTGRVSDIIQACIECHIMNPTKIFEGFDKSLKEEKINIDYVVSLFGDDSHYYKEKEDYNDVPLSPDISGATKFNKKKDISILDIVKDICEYESKYMPENEVASLFDLDTVEEVYEKDENYFISSGLVKIITVYKNKKISLPESLKEDTVIDDFPEPEGEPMSDKEIEEAMGIKEPEEK